MCSPVGMRTVASLSMRIATGFVSPVCCFTVWPAMTYLCLFPGAITTPVIVTLYPCSRGVLTRSEGSRCTSSCRPSCGSAFAFAGHCSSVALCDEQGKLHVHQLCALLPQVSLERPIVGDGG